MADNDPNNWDKLPALNKWGHVGPAADNDFYKFLDKTKKSSDAFFETLSLVFDLVNAALDFIASLLIDFSNPLKLIIEEIVATLEAFINDLRNLGLYMTFDEYELKLPSERLLGGYPAFEQRLIKKLLDQSDPTRPSFSPETKVFAMTFFAGADISKVAQIISYIKKLIKFFTPGKDEPASPPINLEGAFYNDLVGEIELPNTYKPDGIRVKWKLPPPASTLPAFPKSFILPDYFIFSVSTRNAPDVVAYINNVKRTPTEDKSKGDTKSEVVSLPTSHLTDPRLWPLLDESTGLTKLDESKTFKPLDETPDGIGSKGSWVIRGSDEVYLNKIDDQKISDAYRCFIYGSGGDSVIGDDDFSFDIPLENLKIGGQLEDEYNITMYSLTMDKDDFKNLNLDYKKLPGLLRLGTHYEVKSGDLIKIKDSGGGKLTLAPQGEITLPSQTISVATPSDLKSKYIKAVRFFFLAYFLGRLDSQAQRKLVGITFTPEDEKFIAKYVKADDGIKGLVKFSGNKESFAQEVLEWVDDIMINFRHKIPKESILVNFLTDLNKIDNFKYDLYEILQSMAEGDGEGIFPNQKTLKSKENIVPTKVVVSPAEIDSTYNKDVVNVPANVNVQANIFFNEKVSGTNRPLLYYKEGDLKFIGEFVYLKDFMTMFNLAKPLMILSDKGDGEGKWTALRPMRDTDLSALLSVIETIKKYMEGILKGLEGIVAQILKYIHLLKTRIAQLQEVIAKIKGLIDLILSLRFPAGLYGTFHLADGTGGLVNALMQTEDKPDIGEAGFGTGMMVVAGGVPSIIIDLMIALMGGEGGE